MCSKNLSKDVHIEWAKRVFLAILLIIVGGGKGTVSAPNNKG